jgi:tetrahydromethanopterin S-methyltransferase subunit B
MPANAQDTTKKVESEKKVEPEKKTEPEKKAVVKTATPLKTKPAYRYHKIYPTPNQATPNAAAPNPVAPANNDSASLKAQIDPTQLNDKSLNSQYQYLLTKTLRYQQPLIAALWKNVTDTLNHERSQLKDLQNKMATETKAVDSLKALANTKEQATSQSTEKVDTISLFGLVMTKSTYNLLMFGLVIGLAIALVIVALSIAKYKHDAKHHIELHEELEEEFKTYKAKATDKELKLARELQTERNKLDELLGRG